MQKVSVCVRLHAENSEPTMTILKRRVTNKPRRHRLADGQLSSPDPPLPSFSSFGAASVMLGYAPPASSTIPSPSSVYYPGTPLVYVCRKYKV